MEIIFVCDVFWCELRRDFRVSVRVGRKWKKKNRKKSHTKSCDMRIWNSKKKKCGKLIVVRATSAWIFCFCCLSKVEIDERRKVEEKLNRQKLYVVILKVKFSQSHACVRVSTENNWNSSGDKRPAQIRITLYKFLDFFFDVCIDRRMKNMLISLNCSRINSTTGQNRARNSQISYKKHQRKALVPWKAHWIFITYNILNVWT